MANIKKKKLKKAAHLVKAEEKWLIKEYYFLEKLKVNVKKKNHKAGEKLAHRMAVYEPRLEKAHKRVLNILEYLENMQPELYEQVNKIEVDIEIFRADVIKELSRFKGKLTRLFNKKDWEKLVNEVIIRLERDIRGWDVLDKKMSKLLEKNNERWFNHYYPEKRKDGYAKKYDSNPAKKILIQAILEISEMTKAGLFVKKSEKKALELFLSRKGDREHGRHSALKHDPYDNRDEYLHCSIESSNRITVTGPNRTGRLLIGEVNIRDGSIRILKKEFAGYGRTILEEYKDYVDYLHRKKIEKALEEKRKKAA
jgi:hypothetical protein